AAGRDGWADLTLDGPRDSMKPLFEMIRKHVPPVKPDVSAPFSMLVTMIENDPYLGRLVTGRIMSGMVKTNMPVKALTLNGENSESGRVSKILTFRGITREPAESAQAGDIISLAGMAKATVSDTVCAPEIAKPLPSLPID